MKIVIFNNQQTWIKKEESGLFDVTMGAFDGAEVCELVGNFLLYEISKKYDQQNVGLYCNDGLKNVKKSKRSTIRENEKKKFGKSSTRTNLKSPSNVIYKL